jgi:hypothetical protein
LGEFVQAPLYVCYKSSSTAEVLLQIQWKNARLRGLPSGPRQEAAEPG